MPAGSGAGFTSYDTEKSSVVSPKFQPALNAAMLAARMSGLAENFDSRNANVDSVGRWYSHDSRPSANMFFARSASFFDTSMPSTAATVIEVSPTRCTW